MRSVILIAGLLFIILGVATGCAKRYSFYKAKEFNWTEPPFVITIVATEKDREGRKVIENYGSGFVLNKKEGLIVTARHIVRLRVDSVLYALVGERAYSLSSVWTHPTLDIGILKIDFIEPIALSQIEISVDAPPCGSPALLAGFQLGKSGFSLYQIPVDIKKSNKAMRIVAHDRKDTGLEKYNGLSGGPLLDSQNRAIAILEGGPFVCNHKLFFVPLSAIPPKYWPRD